MQTLRSESNPLIFKWIFFSFKIEETYTLTTFVDQKQSLSVLSKSMYDTLVWLAFLDLSKLLKKILDCGSFSIFWKSWPVTGHIATAFIIFHAKMYVSYSSIIEHNCPPKLFKLAFDSWHGYQAKLMLCFHCRFSNLSCSTDHSRTNFLKLGRWNKQS